METYFLVKRDGTFYVQDGRSLFSLQEANDLAAADTTLAIAPGFTLPS